MVHHFSVDDIFDGILNTWTVEFFSNFLEKGDFNINSVNSDDKTIIETVVDKLLAELEEWHNIEDPKQHEELMEKLIRTEVLLHLILKAGADTLKRDTSGATVLNKIMVVYQDSKLIISCLKKIVDIDTVLDYDSGYTALIVAIESEYLHVVKYILTRGADINYIPLDDKETALHYATRCEDSRITHLLLNNGADKEAKDIYGQTPLFGAIFCLNFKQINMFLKYGCNPNAVDSKGNTPLHFLIKTHSDKYYKCSKLVDLFLEYKVDLNVRNSWGCSILHSACKLRKCSLKFLKKLIRNGADTGILDNEGNSFIVVWKEEKGIHMARKIITFLLLEEYKKNLILSENLISSIRSDENLLDFETKCRQELMELSEKKLAPERPISLWNIYCSDTMTVARYCHDEELRSGLSALNLYDYEIFGNRLRRIYSSGLERFQAEVSFWEHFMTTTNGFLSNYALNMIMSRIPTDKLKEIT